MSMSQEEIEALMNGADDFQDDEPLEVEEDNFDDILAGIDGITEDEPVTTPPISSVPNTSAVAPKMDQSKYPLPIENEHKVVNQLNEVAEDSEQKASQIFDVLSFILDENSEIEKSNKQISEFVTNQIELLESLSSKFPNIDIFGKNLEVATSLTDLLKDSSTRVENENNKIFEAMELMQFHDINRQKIERVMAVIRKLSNYLNGIFEDSSEKPEVQIAQHISGDSSETVDADDIESLISEFSN